MSYYIDPRYGHNHAHEGAKLYLDYVMPKLNPDFKLKDADKDWENNGYLSKFDQFKVVEQVAKDLGDPKITAKYL